MSIAVAGPLQEYVEAYDRSRRKVVEEGKRNHEHLTLSWSLEDLVELANTLFRLAAHRLGEWQRAVASGKVAYNETDDRAFQSVFNRLLGQSEEGAWPELEALCREYGPVAGLNELLVHHDKARKTVKEWTPPVLSKARGLHEDSLTQEEADELDRIIRTGEAAVRMPPTHR
jgi:hypothetical protein